MHSGEKSKKCNQCEYATQHTGILRTHWKKRKKRPVEKLNKCNQFDFACSINPSINQLGPKGPQLYFQLLVLSQRSIPLGCIYLPSCVFSNACLKRLNKKLLKLKLISCLFSVTHICSIQSCIVCICLTFLQCVFSNVSSNGLP